MYLGNAVVNGQATARVVPYKHDGHILTIGPTRSGKSRRLLIPNLLFETGRSMLVIDIKGELAAFTAAQREARNRQVKDKMGENGRVVALDPFGVLPRRGVNIERIGFNPMRRLDPDSDHFVDEAMALAEALIEVSPNEHDPHWSRSAQDFVAGLIMLVKWIEGDNASLKIVRQQIASSPEAIQKTATEVMKDESMPDAIKNKLSKFAVGQKNPEIASMMKDESISAEIKEKLSKISHGGGDNRELASIMSNAQTQTRFLDSIAITENLADDGIDFEDLKKERLTVYLVLEPQKLVTHSKWLRLIITSAMTAMQRNTKPDGETRPDVLFMLDEFPQLGRMESIENAVSLNAGYGVKVWVAVQHLGQLKTHYGNNWETFLSAGCVTTSAPRDIFTRDYLTSLIGTQSKIARSTNINSEGGSSVNKSEQKEEIMSPDKWRKMIQGEQFAFIPSPAGQTIERIYGRDFSEMPKDDKGFYIVPTNAPNVPSTSPPKGVGPG